MINRYLCLIALGVSCATVAQTATPPSADPAGAATTHQRDVTNSPAGDSQPSSGTDPGSMATPHQQTVTQAPGRGAAASPQFVTLAAQSGMTEVELSKLALNKTSNPDVKQFATTMIDDHTKANEELQSIAGRKSLSLPTALDSDHAAMVKSMSNQSGKNFDTAYAKHMVADHDKAIELFKSETGDTDQELAAFARKTLPVLQNHQQMAQRLASM